jgi:hypothetical protein
MWVLIGRFLLLVASYGDYFRRKVKVAIFDNATHANAIEKIWL